MELPDVSDRRPIPVASLNYPCMIGHASGGLRRIAQLVIDQPQALTRPEPGTVGTLLLRTDRFRLDVRIEQADRRIKMTDISAIPSQSLLESTDHPRQF